MSTVAVRAGSLALLAILASSTLVEAQAQPSPASLPAQVLSALRTAEPAADSSTLTFFNRDIVILRAKVLERSPGERASVAAHVLHELAAQRITAPVEARSLEVGTLMRVASRFVFAVTDSDIDYLSGETRSSIRPSPSLGW